MFAIARFLALALLSDCVCMRACGCGRPTLLLIARKGASHVSLQPEVIRNLMKVIFPSKEVNDTPGEEGWARRHPESGNSMCDYVCVVIVSLRGCYSVSRNFLRPVGGGLLLNYSSVMFGLDQAYTYLMAKASNLLCLLMIIMDQYCY